MEYIYNPSGLMNVEERELYRKDGFHPTLIGDVLHDGRYCIVHKLGFGGFATVWLARDLHRSKYVALKILAASESSNGRELAILKYIQSSNSDHIGKKHVVQMHDHFDLRGPNGQHLCLVFEVLGPSIGSLRGDGGSDRHMKLRPDVARDLAKQCREALYCLHECGVICVDLNATNILLKLAPIDHLSTQEIYDTFGRPRAEAMELSRSDGAVGSAAPGFIYEPIAFSRVPLHLLVPEVRFIDFGQMVRTTSPLDSDEIGYNAPYAAPELILLHKPSKAADVWALACVLFEMRAGRQLFRGFFGSEEEIVNSMENVLGDLPASWKRQWQTRLTQNMSDAAVEATAEFIGKDADTPEKMAVLSSQDVPIAPTLQSANQTRLGPFAQVLSLITSALPGWLRPWRSMLPSHSEIHEPGSIVAERETESSLHQVIQEVGTWPKHLCRSAKSRKSMILRSSQTTDEGGQLMDLEWVDLLKSPPETLSDEEAEDFESLLSGMLKYDPAARICLEKIRHHQWFSKLYPGVSEDGWLERWF